MEFSTIFAKAVAECRKDGLTREVVSENGLARAVIKPTEGKYPSAKVSFGGNDYSLKSAVSPGSYGQVRVDGVLLSTLTGCAWHECNPKNGGTRAKPAATAFELKAEWLANPDMEAGLAAAQEALAAAWAGLAEAYNASAKTEALSKFDKASVKEARTRLKAGLADEKIVQVLGVVYDLEEAAAAELVRLLRE